MSHLLARVALRPELGAVFDELFTAGGPEIDFQPLDLYAEGEDGALVVTFAEIQPAAQARGEIAIGLRSGTRAADVVLNPAPESRHPVEEGIQVVTVLTFQ